MKKLNGKRIPESGGKPKGWSMEKVHFRKEGEVNRKIGLDTQLYTLYLLNCKREPFTYIFCKRCLPGLFCAQPGQPSEVVLGMILYMLQHW